MILWKAAPARRNLCLMAFVLALATQPAVSQQAAAPSQTPPPQAQPAQQQQFQQSQEWSKLPKMLLERQFAGPLQDTVVQRLRDPVDGTVCYLYLPISVAHSPTTATGFVQYGPNGVGSISCTFAPPAPAAATRPPPLPGARR